MRSGLHTESDTVFITAPVSIIGEPGAVVESTTAPATVYPLEVDAAFHVRGAGDVRISGLELRPPAGMTGGTAVVLEDAPRAAVGANAIHGYQFGVILERADHALIFGNRIAVDPGWSTGALPEAHGIVVINGQAAQIRDNTVSDALFGVWACDLGGTATGNTLSGSFIGIILCNVPVGDLSISGDFSGSSTPGTGWVVRSNVATGNGWGYLVIDGANNNRLAGNAASGNGFYDIELAGDTTRFGFPTLTSYENLVSTGGDRSLVVKDCGRDNRVTGAAQLVDTTVDPCF